MAPAPPSATPSKWAPSALCSQVLTCSPHLHNHPHLFLHTLLNALPGVHQQADPIAASENQGTTKFLCRNRYKGATAADGGQVAHGSRGAGSRHGRHRAGHGNADSAASHPADSPAARQSPHRGRVQGRRRPRPGPAAAARPGRHCRARSGRLAGRAGRQLLCFPGHQRACCAVPASRQPAKNWLGMRASGVLEPAEVLVHCPCAPAAADGWSLVCEEGGHLPDAFGTCLPW